MITFDEHFGPRSKSNFVESNMVQNFGKDKKINYLKKKNFFHWYAYYLIEPFYLWGIFPILYV